MHPQAEVHALQPFSHIKGKFLSWSSQTVLPSEPVSPRCNTPVMEAITPCLQISESAYLFPTLCALVYTHFREASQPVDFPGTVWFVFFHIGYLQTLPCLQAMLQVAPLKLCVVDFAFPLIHIIPDSLLISSAHHSLTGLLVTASIPHHS